jgi:hypothetical protein
VPQDPLIIAVPQDPLIIAVPQDPLIKSILDQNVAGVQVLEARSTPDGELNSVLDQQR